MTNKYVGGVEFIPIMLKAGTRGDGYDVCHDLNLGGVFDGKEVIDIIKSVVVVEWNDRGPHPQAGQPMSSGFGKYPETVDVHRTEPRECMVAVVARSRDEAIAAFALRVENLKEEVASSERHRMAAEDELDAAKKELSATRAVCLEQGAEYKRAHADNIIIRNGKDEAERIVKDLRAELDRIKLRVGTERFDELRKA